MSSEAQRSLAQRAVERRLLTENQILACLRRCGASGLPLDRLLEDEGLLTREEIRSLASLDAPTAPAASAGRCAVCGYAFHAPRAQAAPCPECGVETSGATPAGGTPPYQLHEEVGRGPHGVVFRALGADGLREFAFKRLHAPSRPSPVQLRLPALNHPNVASVAALGVYEKSAWIATEFVHGIPLLDHVLGSIRLPAEEALLVLKQVAAALSAAHARGIVHGGLRPQNVFVTETREVKVVDFALPRPGTAPPELLPWAAPELDAHPPGPSSDLYSCGVLGYFMLAGRLPFESGSPDELRRLRATRPVPLLAGRVPELPAGTDSVLQKLMQREPAMRYRHAAALAADLDRLENGQPPLALRELMPSPPPPPVRPAARPRPRPRRR
jgi:serine/threonine protein kinase